MHPTAPDLRRRYADAGHGQIHYYDSGPSGREDAVPLLLLHQSPSSSADWFPLVPLLRRAGLRVMAMDTPGMGLSDPFPDAPTIADYASAVGIVLADAGVDRADLLGHHTGAQIAVEAAVRLPSKVRAVALYGAPLMSAAERQEYWERFVPREREGAVHRPVTGAANLTDHFNRIDGIFGPVAAQRMLLGALLAGPLWWHGHNAALTHDIAPALRAMTQPLLLISHPGEFLDANTLEAARLKPDAAYVSLGEGRLAMDDEPEKLAEAMMGFLREVEEGPRAIERGLDARYLGSPEPAVP